MDNLQQPEEPLAPEDDWDLIPDVAQGIVIVGADHAVENGQVPLICADRQVLHTSAPVGPTVLSHRTKVDHFPAIASRSGLFCVGRSTDPLPYNGAVKAQGSYGLHFNGDRLYMRDKQVWEATMQIAKDAPGIEQEIQVALSDIAKRMGSSDMSGDALKWIWGSLERLAKANVQVRLHDGQVHAGSLLASTRHHGKQYFIQLDLALAVPLFALDMQFKIQSKRRLTLSTSLAQWLHDFISTHASYPRNLTLGYIRELCGYDGQMRRFPALLSAALLELSSAAPELVSSYEILKTGRSSENWEIKISRGADQPVFLMPKPGLGIDGTPRASKGKGVSTKPWLAL